MLLGICAGIAVQRRIAPALGDAGCGEDEELAEKVLDRYGWHARRQEFRNRAETLVEEHWSEIAAVATDILRQLDEAERNRHGRARKKRPVDAAARQKGFENAKNLRALFDHMTRPVPWLDPSAPPDIQHEIQLRALDDQLAGYDSYAAALLRTTTDQPQRDHAANILHQTQWIRGEINRGALISATTLAIDLGIMWHQGVVEYQWVQPAHERRQRGGRNAAQVRNAEIAEIHDSIEELRARNPTLSYEAAARSYLGREATWLLEPDEKQDTDVTNLTRRLCRHRRQINRGHS